MTREEAIEKVDGLEPFDLPTRRQKNELLIDKLVALGILKLDEPKSVEDQVAEILRTNGGISEVDVRKVQRSLAEAGFHIVRFRD